MRTIPKNTQATGSSPESLITTFFFGRSPRSVSWDSISFTISIPSITCPKTTCLLSSHGVCNKTDDDDDDGINNDNNDDNDDDNDDDDDGHDQGRVRDV